MKFLLEWVSCCGAAARTSDSLSSEIKTHPPYVAAEDTGLLVRPRKRGRLGSRSGTPASDWKPSLCAISEEGVLMMERGGGGGGGGEGGGERKVERKRTVAAAAVTVTKKTSRARVHNRGYRDDYGRASVQTVIPAFSPTPFVF